MVRCLFGPQNHLGFILCSLCMRSTHHASLHSTLQHPYLAHAPKTSALVCCHSLLLVKEFSQLGVKGIIYITSFEISTTSTQKEVGGRTCGWEREWVIDRRRWQRKLGMGSGMQVESEQDFQIFSAFYHLWASTTAGKIALKDLLAKSLGSFQPPEHFFQDHTPTALTSPLSLSLLLPTTWLKLTWLDCGSACSSNWKQEVTQVPHSVIQRLFTVSVCHAISGSFKLSWRHSKESLFLS